MFLLIYGMFLMKKLSKRLGIYVDFLEMHKSSDISNDEIRDIIINKSKKIGLSWKNEDEINLLKMVNSVQCCDTIITFLKDLNEYYKAHDFELNIDYFFKNQKRVTFDYEGQLKIKAVSHVNEYLFNGKTRRALRLTSVTFIK